MRHSSTAPHSSDLRGFGRFTVKFRISEVIAIATAPIGGHFTNFFFFFIIVARIWEYMLVFVRKDAGGAIILGISGGDMAETFTDRYSGSCPLTIGSKWHGT